ARSSLFAYRVRSRPDDYFTRWIMGAPSAAGPRGRERAGVAEDRPAADFGQDQPGGEVDPTSSSYLVDLTVGLALDLLRRPVGRLGIERSRGRAIALALGAVAGNAVRLGQLLALRHRFGIRRQRILLALFGRRRSPRCLLSTRGRV